MNLIDDLKIKIFADGADLFNVQYFSKKSFIRGFTTNPTLMYKAGITEYHTFANKLLNVIRDYPVSFEVFSDDLNEMALQALEISSWGSNVYVKIPITNTVGVSTTPIIEILSHRGVKLNITAIMTVSQVKKVLPCLKDGLSSFISIFAGRIADTGLDPIPMLCDILKLAKEVPNVKVIWASPREVLNIFQADKIGCHIITATNDILNKLELVGKDLNEYSLETVRMFYQDAKKAGFSIPLPSNGYLRNRFFIPSRRSEYRVNVRMPCWLEFQRELRLETRTIDVSYSGASLENLSFPVVSGQAIKYGMKLNNQSSEIVREGMIVRKNKERINLSLDTTQVQKTAIRQELELISNNRILLLNDRRRFELRVPVQTNCKVSLNRNESVYEFNTSDISFSGLAMEDLPGNWQKKDIWIEISFPNISTTYSLGGFIQWRNGSKAGIQIDANSPNYIQYCNVLKQLIKSKKLVSLDLYTIQQESLEQLFNIGQSILLEPIHRVE